MKKRSSTQSLGVEDILGGVHISNNVKMPTERLSEEQKIQFAMARMHGYRPVGLRWTSGEDAIVLTNNADGIPNPEQNIAAFFDCQRLPKTGTKGRK